MVDAGVNAHVAVHHGRRAMGLLHAAFGIGATAGPLLVTGLLSAVLWLDVGGTGVVGLPLVGLSLAPVFPTLVSLTPERLGAARAAHAIGYQLAAAGAGAAALPGAVALGIGAGGLGALGPSLMALALTLAALQAAAHLAARPAVPNRAT